MEKKATTSAFSFLHVPGRKLYLLLFLLTNLIFAASFAQTTRVSGTVNDSKGNPLQGVSVIVKGTTTATITDANGKFTLAAPGKQSVLSFSFVGYNSIEQVVGDKTSFNITLSDGGSNLD